MSTSTPSTVTTAASVPFGSIVVGVDGSACADRALAWATTQARLEHRPLTIAYSCHLGLGGELMWTGQPAIDVGAILEEFQIAGRQVLDASRARALVEAPDLDVHLVLATDDARSLLLELGEHAALVVVGSRGRGPVKSLLLGSVSVSVSKHAACPVVVVRQVEDAHRRGGVLVGVDGTEDSLPAIDLAFRLASLRSLPLTALHVHWDAGDPTAEPVVTEGWPGLQDEQALLSESLAGMREKFPEVEHRLVLARGLRDQQLISASHDADLVVVGSRRRGVLEDLLHGSVAPAVVEHAGCDVVVVPTEVLPG